jgi:hypothetical protein
MSDLRPKPPEIEIGGKKYGVLFNLNAIDEIQDIFDIPISQLPELMRDERKAFKVLKTLLAILINEAIDDSESGEKHVDEKFVGRKITVKDIPTLKEKVFDAFTGGMPEGDDEAPNAQSE